MTININIPIDRITKEVRLFVKYLSYTPKRKLDKSLWFIDCLLAKIALFLFIVCLIIIFTVFILNWFNIVLFVNESGKKDVMKEKKYAYASYTLAPKRFSWLRLHNTILPEGFKQINQIVFVKTKYYDFTDMWFAVRSY